MTAALTPDHRLPTEVAVPVSKSVAQRTIVAAALCHGATRVVGIDQAHACDDVRAALALARALGAELTQVTPKALTIRGNSPAHGPLTAGDQTLAAGESGTLARLATAIAALCLRGETTVTANGSLLKRTSPPLFESLLLAGARLRTTTTTPSGGWPVTLRGIGPPSDLYLKEPVSSQELTALLLVAASYPDPIRVHVHGRLPSESYLEVTRRALMPFGVVVTELPETQPHKELDVRRVFEAAGVLAPSQAPIFLDGDASAAAVALTAGAICGQPVFVPGSFAQSAQGDARIVDLLERMGAAVTAEDDGWRANVGRQGRLERGLEVDLTSTPDLVAPLAAAALAAARHAGATSRLAGLGTLRGKESDRLAVLAGALRAVGATVEIGGSDQAPNLLIAPGPATDDVLLQPHGDHRMAFAFALFGLVQPGVRVANPDVVAKSWPRFWEALGAAKS